MATPIQFHFSCAAPAPSALSSSHLSTTSHRSLSPCPCPSPTLLSSHSQLPLPLTLTHQHQHQHQKHQHQFIRLKPRSSASASASKPQQQGQPHQQDEEDHEPHVNDPGVKLALSLLHFYKREISPLLPRSCRYVPTCSDYSILAFKKYGLPKGFILTACRICRCNPFGGYGFDPPRWFGEEREEPYSSDL